MKAIVPAIITLLSMPVGSVAQMLLSLPAQADVAVAQMTDGSTLMQLPLTDSGTYSLAAVSVTVDGTAVSPSAVVPDPRTLTVSDGERVVFYHQGKAYAFTFTVGHYFTVLMLSDPHTAQSGHDGTSVADMQAYLGRALKIGDADGPHFSFAALPGYVPRVELAISLGDMDQDSEKSGSNFRSAHQPLLDAGIPFITICGNHDLVPDYWTGNSPDKGLTYGWNDGGSYCNDVARGIVEDYCSQAVTLAGGNITDYQQITDGSSRTQAKPFTFKYKGVRFYCGQTYWFQKPYTKPSLFTAATYYAPDGVVDAFETFVRAHADEPSVFTQHYPLLAGSDCDRWWLDQNDVGLYIKTTDSSAYGTDLDLGAYNSDSNAQAYALKKKNRYADIMLLTKNPVHFSGHTHSYAQNTFRGITDYTVAATGRSNGGLAGGYLVLCKQGTGVVEVQRVHFSETNHSGYHDTSCPTLAPTATGIDGGKLALLCQGVEHLDATTFASDLTAARSAATADAVSQALARIANTLATYVADHGGSNVDVTPLLGLNTDFESTESDALTTNNNVHPQTGWTLHVVSHTNADNTQYIHLRQRTDDGAPTAHSIYLRAKWQAYTCTDQALRQAMLPAGTYTLKLRIKHAGTLTDNLCYYELNGRRTTIASTTAWALRTYNLTLTEPTLLTLSLGFTGGVGTTESAVSADDITLVCKSITQADTDPDMTGLIVNATFSQGYTGEASGSRVQIPDGWTFVHELDGWRDCFVDASAGVFNAWAGTITRAELMQTVGGLPSGNYRLTADVKTDQPAAASRIALYGYGDTGSIGRSEEAGAAADGGFATYSCAFSVASGAATIGIRSDRGYYQVKNLKLEYLGADGADEVAASRLRQDYYWGGARAATFDATATSYAAARGVVLYPLVDNQLITATSATQLAQQHNVIVDGQCASLRISDGTPITIADSFHAAQATYTREESGTWHTLCLPFQVQSDEGCGVCAIAEESGDKVLLTLMRSAEAYTPAIITTPDGSSFTIEATDVDICTPPTPGIATEPATPWTAIGNTSEAAITASAGAYQLVQGQLVAATTDITVPPYRAVFRRTDAGAGSYTLSTDISTGISPAEGTITHVTTVLHDLGGRRVAVPARHGIYIAGRRKVVVK